MYNHFSRISVVLEKGKRYTLCEEGHLLSIYYPKTEFHIEIEYIDNQHFVFFFHGRELLYESQYKALLTTRSLNSLKHCMQAVKRLANFFADMVVGININGIKSLLARFNYTNNAFRHSFDFSEIDKKKNSEFKLYDFYQYSETDTNNSVKFFKFGIIRGEIYLSYLMIDDVNVEEDFFKHPDFQLTIALNDRFHFVKNHIFYRMDSIQTKKVLAYFHTEYLYSNLIFYSINDSCNTILTPPFDKDKKTYSAKERIDLYMCAILNRILLVENSLKEDVLKLFESYGITITTKVKPRDLNLLEICLL